MWDFCLLLLTLYAQEFVLRIEVFLQNTSINFYHLFRNSLLPSWTLWLFLVTYFSFCLSQLDSGSLFFFLLNGQNIDTTFKLSYDSWLFPLYLCLCSSAVYLKCFLSCCCQVPFPELHGEFTEYVGRAEDAIIAMSNYRLHIKFKKSVVNVSISKWQVRFSVVASEKKNLSRGTKSLQNEPHCLHWRLYQYVCILWMDRALWWPGHSKLLSTGSSAMWLFITSLSTLVCSLWLLSGTCRCHGCSWPTGSCITARAFLSILFHYVRDKLC